ncbi:hypothetical protein MSAN_02374600 [Mycena sanguinolenta]|uniref:Uncharacterized protein n=1 Tax=Mycena sanguinolenta TaxID=230812 RepID=A0A8H6X602_9AGAR|nr:hypothetical protein MSAN_02374600 [Mycena sanguinolenta]
MSQYLRSVAGPDAGVTDKDAGDGTVDTVFLEDLEVYKADFNPDAPCGVFDIDLQDPTLKSHYVNLHPLLACRRIVPAYDRNRTSIDDIDYSTGGRVRFSSWFQQCPRMLAANSMGAMLFTQSEPHYINLSRISPLELSIRPLANNATSHRLYYREHIAICVSAICCTESHLVTARRVGINSDRTRKYVSGVFHDQNWERFESILCLVYGQKVLYGQLADKSISFQTVISPASREGQEGSSSVTVPNRMFSIKSPSKAVKAKPDADKRFFAYENTACV